MVWALDFQFVSTIDGKAIKIASTRDEHTRIAPEPGRTLDRRQTGSSASWRRVSPPPAARRMMLRMDNGPEFISQALQQFCAGKVGLSDIRRGTQWKNAYIESFNNRLRRECLNPNPLDQRARSPRDERRLQARAQHAAPRLSAGLPTPAEYAARCSHTHPPRGLRDQLKSVSITT